MKSTFIASSVLALAALTGASAFAQNSNLPSGESGYKAPANFKGQLSRAEVKADYLQAQKGGKLSVRGDSDLAIAPASPSMVTRAEVYAGAVQWTKNHPADVMSN